MPPAEPAGDSIDSYEANSLDVRRFLARIGIEKYTDSLVASGWDRLEDLQAQTKQEQEAIAVAASMLPGHAFRFVSTLQSTAGSRSPPPPPLPSQSVRLAVCSACRKL